MKIAFLGLTIFFTSIFLSFFYGEAFESRPVISDELAYNFQSQTYLMGRVTNPSPDSAMHFESQGILVEPTFSAKYPPMLAGGMAIGKKIFDSEHIVGRLCLGLSCTLILLILLEFFSLALSFVVASIATMNSFYIFEFANSYRPAAISLFAACLVFYCCIKHLKIILKSKPENLRFEILLGIALGVGVGVLALSRPFIAVMTFALSLSFYSWKALRNGRKGWVVPFMAVLSIFISVQLYVNKKVTSNALKHPHTLVTEKYFMNPGFNFLHKDEVQNYHGNKFLERYYYEWEKEIFQRQTTFDGFLYEYFVEKVHKYIMFHSTYFLVPLFLLGLFFLIASVVKRRDPLHFFVALSLLGYFVATLFVVGHLYFYTVTFVPIFFVIIATGICGILRISEQRKLAHITARLFIVILILFSITQLNMQGFDFAASRTDRGSYYKKEFEESLKSKFSNRKLVVFSQFAESHSIFDTWVYSNPDISSATILWVTDLGRDRNQSFLANYPDRLGICAFFDNSSPVIDPKSSCY